MKIGLGKYIFLIGLAATLTACNTQMPGLELPNTLMKQYRNTYNVNYTSSINPDYNTAGFYGKALIGSREQFEDFLAKIGTYLQDVGFHNSYSPNSISINAHLVEGGYQNNIIGPKNRIINIIYTFKDGNGKILFEQKVNVSANTRGYERYGMNASWTHALVKQTNALDAILNVADARLSENLAKQ